MISLEKKQLVLIEYYQHNMSQRQIAEKLKMSRNTVKKYIEQDLVARQQDTRNLPITDNYVTPPAYKKRNGKKRALTNTVMKRIREMMKQNKNKREVNMHKQQLKIIDIHEKLLDEGFKIGYTTVRNFVNREEKKEKEVFIRQEPTAGREIEFDWGEVKLFIDGKLRSLSMAVFTLAYSNDRYARLYESETMVCVQDAHVKCIEALGFVPNVFTYDNMRTVVKNFIGYDRFITDGMKSLSLHYHFQIRLCQPRKGNEKGHVERSVEYIRRKAFAHRDTFTSLEEAQEYLVSIIEKLNQRPHYLKEKTHHELMLEEKAERAGSLTAAPFDPAELVELRVDKYSTVTYRHNRYSVPEGHVGEYIKLKARAEEVLLFSEGECIAKHKRSWQVHVWVMNIYHYLNTLQKKKGALAQSECLSQAPKQIKNIYQRYYIGNEKDFLELLVYTKERDCLARVLEVITELEKNPLVQLTTEKIIFLAEQSAEVRTVLTGQDDVASQSLDNLSSLAALFHSKGTGVVH